MLSNNNIHADGATGRSGKDYNDYIIQWVTCSTYLCVYVWVHRIIRLYYVNVRAERRQYGAIRIDEKTNP